MEKHTTTREKPKETQGEGGEQGLKLGGALEFKDSSVDSTSSHFHLFVVSYHNNVLNFSLCWD